MATLGQLRASAKQLGISASAIRSATSAEELQALIVEYATGNGAKAAPKPARKAKTPAAVPARRGRPPKVAANKPKPAASPARGKAKRPAAVDDDEAGRRLLVGVDFSDTEGWSPRVGSPPDLIIKSLRKYKGNREKVFQALVPNIKAFVGERMRSGVKRSKENREDMLRYRISRTAWDFAMKTGQHQKSDHRAEYGSGAAATPAKKKATPKATPARKAPVKKPVVRKAAVGRPAKKKRVVRR